MLKKKQDISYKLRRTSSARRVKISIDREGQVNLTVPRFIPIKMAEMFLISKKDWIFQKLDEVKTIKLQTNLLKRKYPDYKSSRKEALGIIKKTVEEVNEFYNYKYGRITVKNQSTCWGSCSAKGNLNFNYKLAYMDEKYMDYVVTHELCHLKELNHSKRFWALVAQRLPNYRVVQREMRRRGLELK
jgi:predicted metal-dependent hydrolase